MQKSKKPRENQKKQKKQKTQYSRTLACWPYLQTSGFFGFLEVFWICAFLLLQESWNIVFFDFFVFFGFLEVFWIFAFARVLEYCFFVFSRFFIFFSWHRCKYQKNMQRGRFFLGGVPYIYFRPWLSRPNFGRNKTDLQQFFDSVQISFHFDKCSFFTVFSMVSVLCTILL